MFLHAMQYTCRTSNILVAQTRHPLLLPPLADRQRVLDCPREGSPAGDSHVRGREKVRRKVIRRRRGSDPADLYQPYRQRHQVHPGVFTLKAHAWVCQCCEDDCAVMERAISTLVG